MRRELLSQFFCPSLRHTGIFLLCQTPTLLFWRLKTSQRKGAPLPRWDSPACWRRTKVRRMNPRFPEEVMALHIHSNRLGVHTMTSFLPLPADFHGNQKKEKKTQKDWSPRKKKRGWRNKKASKKNYWEFPSSSPAALPSVEGASVKIVFLSFLGWHLLQCLIFGDIERIAFSPHSWVLGTVGLWCPHHGLSLWNG